MTAAGEKPMAIDIGSLPTTLTPPGKGRPRARPARDQQGIRLSPHSRRFPPSSAETRIAPTTA